MPIYEYDCQVCGKEFERLVSMEDRMNTPCPECETPAHMKISAVRSKLDPISGDFPGATIKWENNRKQKMAQEKE